MNQALQVVRAQPPQFLASLCDAALSVDVVCDGDAVRATIIDRRVDVRDAFTSLDASRATALASDAWSLGFRAVISAHRLAQESQFANIGSTLVTEIEHRFTEYVTKQQESIGETLRGYFDPRDGKVTLRLEAFLKNDGELSRTLATYLAPETGALAKTLAREVGDQSPLLRKLSATDAEGVVTMIERALQSTLQQNQASLTRALDPLAPDGAVARLMAELRREMSKADKDQSEKLAAVTKALDANDENSLLSRLLRESQTASRSVMHSMNPDVPGSALAVLKSSLTTVLEGYGKRQDEAFQAFDDRQLKIEQGVREAVARLDERRKSDSRTTRGGIAFEEAVAVFAHAAAVGAPIVVEAVGKSVGRGPSCKVGDVVMRYSAESIYARSALVIEAKRDASYGVARALEELAVARTNRDATAGLFVMARSHAPAGFGGLRRFGDDILVAWDPEDPSTDPYLDAAIILGLALAARGSRTEHTGEIDALADIEHRITQELDRHEKMQKLTERIRKDAEAISEHIKTSDGKLSVLLKKARSTLKALNVERNDLVEERQNPVGLPPGAIDRARLALGTGDDTED